MQITKILHRKRLHKSLKIYLEGMGPDNHAAIPILLTHPIKINHTVEHKPYPRPTLILITVKDDEGRRYHLDPIHCRGGGYYPLQLPNGFNAHMLEVDVRYEDNF